MANSNPEKTSDLVHNSRAGDQFHYRWAARRCLRMIDPKSELSFVTVEASEDQNKAGEYVIDVAEYFERKGDQKQIRYSQLKHSEVRIDANFTISELSSTLKGFAELFGKHKSDTVDDQYSIITNRKVSDEFKEALATICSGKRPYKRPRESLESATSLSDAALRSFCSKLTIVDDEGDYLVQKSKLHQETGDYIAGFIRADFVDRLIQLIAERALPRDDKGQSNHKVTRENVLEKIGVYDSSQLFPAPSEIEQLLDPITRKQHNELFSAIRESGNPIIITAEGGVGKSILSQQLANAMPEHSMAILYDCFGAGEYRNPARPRHEPQQALIQIVNECAREGLCKSLLPTEVTDCSSLYRKFERRLTDVVTHLKEIDSSAELLIIVDAADNAVMQATHKSDRCFVNELFHVNFPYGTKLVMLCRPERLNLLQAPSNVDVLPLEPFSVQESSLALKKTFPEATDSECEEFHRLSAGNPRVQAYALNEGSVRSLADALNLLGPNPTTVSDQIEDLLAKALAKVKDRLVGKFVDEIDSICQGLTNLPPLVPLEVLSKAAEVEISTVKSFISELGRALLLTEENVLFRDEPTEDWFKKRFSASPDLISSFIERIKPMAAESDYVARALPPLMLEANQYEKLIQFALRDIEKEGRAPSDVQNVRLYNLRFAFKAALKREDLKSASMISIWLGEEAAGSERRLSYLRNNLDLIPPLLGAEHTQELAYQSKIKSGWMGSQNVFSASLLSAIPGCAGYANSYLRAAENWIRIYFDKREKKTEENSNYYEEEALSGDDVAEILWAIFCLDGLEASMNYISSHWKPDSWYFYVVESFAARLVDAGYQQKLVEYLDKEAPSFYISLAVIHQIFQVGLLPNKCELNPIMESLLNGERRPELKRDMGITLDPLPDAIISFLEVFLKCGGDRQMIINALDTHHLDEVSYPPTHDSQVEQRRLYLRAVCLRSYVLNEKEPDPLASTFDRNEDDAAYAIDQMIPIYFRRLLALNGGISEALEKTLTRSASYDSKKYYRQFDYIKRERFSVLFESSCWITQEDDEIHEYLLSRVGTPESLQLPDRIKCLRTAYRQEHLSRLRDPLEQFVKNVLSSYTEYDNPESKADEYASLARAVLNLSPEGSKVYLNYGLNVSEMVGDEAVSRWSAITTVAQNVARESEVSAEIFYRYIRCAEYVGDVVQREKYWDRDAAIEIGYALNPSAAIAALSRWRDRQIGFFDRHINSILRKGLEHGQISSEFAWCFTGLEGCNGSLGLAKEIISNVESTALKRALFDKLKRDVELQGATQRDVEKLEAILIQISGGSAEELEMEVHCDSVSDADRRSANRTISTEYKNVTIQPGMDLLDDSVIGELIEEFEKLEYPRCVERFVGALVAAVPHGKEYEFVDVFLRVFPEYFAYYNVPDAVGAIRNAWGQRTSIEANWSNILERIGKAYARSVLSYHTDRSLFEKLAESPEEIAAIKRGATDGIFDLIEGLGSHAYFGFAAAASSSLNLKDSLSLLEFSLSRFERNLEEGFSDGMWEDWLDAQHDLNMSYASLLWACLGSPDSGVRWQGAHCVRRAVEVNCEVLIESLIALFFSGLDELYVGKSLPNYELHSKVHFLVGCKRTVISSPDSLRRHSDFFKRVALESVGLFIKRTAAEIALLMHEHDATLYSADEISSLSSVLESKFEPVRTGRLEAKFELPDKLKGSKTKSDFSIGLDFDSYWVNGLANVFRIKKSDLRELVVSQIQEIAGISPDGLTRVREDPRWLIWKRELHGQRAYDLQYSHFSYPRIEGYQFYTTYHGLMNAAALLFESMPTGITSYSDGDLDEWTDWLSGHIHSREDGTWLSDRRDPIPTRKSKWLEEKNASYAVWDLGNDLFIEAVSELSSLPESYVVDGNWEDFRGNSNYMRTSIRSAFVSTETSNALVTYLNAAEDYMCYFPNSGLESATRRFQIIRPSIKLEPGSSGRDEYDPYANDIRFPPIELSARVVEDFKLMGDSEKRAWKRQDGVSVARSLTWRDSRPYYREDNRREGSQLSVNIELLKQCCIRYESDLVLIVNIDRGETERYRRGSSYTDERIPDSRKIYILGHDGILRETW